jgi:DNA polymerase/3'-5' exonuclease PolX
MTTLTIGGAQVNFREKIIEDLELLRKKEQQERNVFKVRAYDKVIKELRSFTKPIHTIDDIAEIPGIGDRIRAKIQEIISTGELAAAEAVKKDSGINATDIIMKIHGIGAVKASDLIKKHNIRSIAGLREAVEKDPKLLNSKQKIGLKYFEDIQERIPRTEMLLHEKRILKAVSDIDSKFEAIIVGSFRREAPTSGDIDVLISYPEGIKESDAEKRFTEIVTALETDGYISDILAKGPKKCMAISKLPNGKARRLDLLLTPPEEFPYALLYFTGSDKFNIQVRKKAIDIGYSLSEHGLKTHGKVAPKKPLIKMKTEKDILDFLEVPFISPKER